MLYTCVRKFDVTGTAQIFLGTKRPLRLDLVWLEMGGAVGARRWDGWLGLGGNAWTLPLGAFHPRGGQGNVLQISSWRWIGEVSHAPLASTQSKQKKQSNRMH